MRDQEIIGLWEAYQQIHAQTDVVSEDAQQAVGKALDAAANNPVIKAIGSVIAPAGKGRKTPTATSGGYRPVKEDIDIFDVILEYLVAEGYADTNKAALAIMANMSEEWKQSIVEEVLDEELTGTRREKAKKIMADPATPKSKRDALNRVLTSREGSTALGRQPSANIIGDGSPQKLPTKRGGGGIKGRAKVTTIGGSKMDQRSGNRATERAGGGGGDTSDEN